MSVEEIFLHKKTQGGLGFFFLKNVAIQQIV
jgi:hypothetical protein